MIKNGIHNFYSNRNVNEIKKKRLKKGKNKDNEFNNRFVNSAFSIPCLVWKN